jgi:fumarylacetoacetase
VSEVEMHLPVRVGDFSDFSSAKDHVLNAGEAVFGVRSLPAGFSHFPLAYAGRSSSIVPSGTNIRRPRGQFRSGDGVEYGVSKDMDYELEVACVIGRPSQFGEPVPIDDADEHIFGFLLLNDWSGKTCTKPKARK